MWQQMIDWVDNERYIPNKRHADIAFNFYFGKKSYNDWYVKAFVKLYRKVHVFSEHSDIRFYIKKLLACYISHFLKRTFIKKKMVNFIVSYYDIDDFGIDLYNKILAELDDYSSGSTYLFFLTKATYLYRTKRTTFIKAKSNESFSMDDTDSGFDNICRISSIEDDIIANEMINNVFKKIDKIKIRFTGKEEKICRKIINYFKSSSVLSPSFLKMVDRKFKGKKGKFLVQYCRIKIKQIIVNEIGKENIKSIQDVINISNDIHMQKDMIVEKVRGENTPCKIR